MIRSDLNQRLANRFLQLTVTDTEVCVKTILDAISLRLCEGGRAEIRGFGVFEVNARPARIGRNPKTGERVAVPEKQVPHFKASKELTGRVVKA